tara:strand:- start:7978 stop:8277 length:300 start_codon:yes stop_codon:yes gene_type:complete
MAKPNPTAKTVQDEMSAGEREAYLWESLDLTVEAFTGDRGAAVLHHARLKGMNPLDLTTLELTGDLSAHQYPIIRFAGEAPGETFTFSPQGGYRRTEFE